MDLKELAEKLFTEDNPSLRRINSLDSSPHKFVRSVRFKYQADAANIHSFSIFNNQQNNIHDIYMEHFYPYLEGIIAFMYLIEKGEPGLWLWLYDYPGAEEYYSYRQVGHSEYGIFEIAGQYDSASISSTYVDRHSLVSNFKKEIRRYYNDGIEEKIIPFLKDGCTKEDVREAIDHINKIRSCRWLFPEEMTYLNPAAFYQYADYHIYNITEQATNILEPLRQTPPDYETAQKIMNDSSLSAEELAIIANELVYDCFHEQEVADYYGLNKHERHSTYLTKSLKILLAAGLDPNQVMCKRNASANLRFIDMPFTAAEILKLFLQHGLSSYLEVTFDYDYTLLESTTDELCNTVKAEKHIPYEIFYRWILLLAYIEPKALPLKLLDNIYFSANADFQVHNFINYADYDYHLADNQPKYKWKIEIFSKNMAEVVAVAYEKISHKASGSDNSDDGYERYKRIFKK